ncbi:hypothetical protein E5288_WYG003441 [Bos mutus]|uniref:Uncharacterized protein n=1 Tax=Bos mutus TaxID=72004 RepID=A0A6B0S2E2_9CETA|nr:hypothetical protein [Bos mutus]
MKSFLVKFHPPPPKPPPPGHQCAIYRWGHHSECPHPAPAIRFYVLSMCQAAGGISGRPILEKSQTDDYPEGSAKVDVSTWRDRLPVLTTCELVPAALVVSLCPGFRKMYSLRLFEGLDCSHPSNEPPWRRLGDVSWGFRWMRIKHLGLKAEVMDYFLIAVKGNLVAGEKAGKQRPRERLKHVNASPERGLRYIFTQQMSFTSDQEPKFLRQETGMASMSQPSSAVDLWLKLSMPWPLHRYASVTIMAATIQMPDSYQRGFRNVGIP